MNGRASWRAADAPAWLVALGLAPLGAGWIAVGCALDPSGTADTGSSSASSSSSSSTGTAGGGGAGGGGGNQGGGGEGGAPLQVIATWDAATEPVQPDGTYTLPSWLGLQSPSTDKTVQTGPDTIRTGFGVDAARARNAGKGWGLSVESRRENRAGWTRIDPAGWTYANGVVVTPASGPDGSTGAVQLSDVSTTLISSAYADVAPGVPGEPATLSVWVANVTVDNAAFIGSSLFDPQGVFIPAHTGWARSSLTATEQTATFSRAQLYPATGGFSNLGFAMFDYVSFESAKYPSSVIVTTNGLPVTREPERLHVVNTSPSELAPNDRFHVRLVFAPSYRATEQDADHDLLFFDANNRVYLNPVAHTVVLIAAGGALITSDTLAFERDEAITVELLHTGTDVTLTVTDPAGATQTQTAPLTVPLPFPDDLTVLGDDTGSQECADLRSITFYQPP